MIWIILIILNYINSKLNYIYTWTLFLELLFTLVFSLMVYNHVTMHNLCYVYLESTNKLSPLKAIIWIFHKSLTKHKSILTIIFQVSGHDWTKVSCICQLASHCYINCVNNHVVLNTTFVHKKQVERK